MVLRSEVYEQGWSSMSQYFSLFITQFFQVYDSYLSSWLRWCRHNCVTSRLTLSSRESPHQREVRSSTPLPLPTCTFYRLGHCVKTSWPLTQPVYSPVSCCLTVCTSVPCAESTFLVEKNLNVNVVWVICSDYLDFTNVSHRHDAYNN